MFCHIYPLVVCRPTAKPSFVKSRTAAFQAATRPGNGSGDKILAELLGTSPVPPRNKAQLEKDSFVSPLSIQSAQELVSSALSGVDSQLVESSSSVRLFDDGTTEQQHEQAASDKSIMEQANVCIALILL